MDVWRETTSKGLREGLVLDGIISVLQRNKWRWYGHVLQKRQCMGEEMYGV